MKMGGLHLTKMSHGARSLLARARRVHVPRARDPDASIQGESVDAIVAESGHSVIRLIELLIERAHSARASDLHLDPTEVSLQVRERIDGSLVTTHNLPITLHAEIISRIKILSGLRIDEHYCAQDGRFRLSLSGGSVVDIRVSIAPTYYGENAVLRILSDGAMVFTLESLGFSARNHAVISRALARPHGMILATGPTGSGKTTTLYTLVQMLNQPDVSIITLEDPIEYSMQGVRQIQVNAKTGLTFGNGLRSVLRQDPDILMVGEVRDRETAGLAVNTALTGHRILSTLHTNDAPSTVTRLLDMGVEPYLIASTISVVVAQRLVRVLCDSCKIPQILSDHELSQMSMCTTGQQVRTNHTFYVSRGCTECSGTGFRGRVGLHEVMEMTPAMREGIVRRASVDELRSIAERDGMSTLMTDGFCKASRGSTSIAEILKLQYE